MTEQMHPMVPPNILLNNWESDWFNERENVDVLLIQAYQAGADAELEACCEWLDDYLLAPKGEQLRAARRPKPKSLKEQALQVLGLPIMSGESRLIGHRDHDLLRRALEESDD